MNSQSSQDELVLQLYAEAQTQVALVLLTAFHSMKSQTISSHFIFVFQNCNKIATFFFFFWFTSDSAHADLLICKSACERKEEKVKAEKEKDRGLAF